MPESANINIPFRLLGGLVLVPAQIEGKIGHLAFDTGAMMTALNRCWFPNLGGGELEIAKFSGEMKSETAGSALVNLISLPGLALKDRQVMVMDLTYAQDALRTLDPELKLLGSLGIDAIRDFTVLLDYAKETLTLNPPFPFESFTRIPMTTEAFPTVDITIEGTTRSFVLDTGANTCLLSCDLAGALTVRPVDDSPGVYIIPKVELCGNVYHDVTAVFSDICAIQEKAAVEGVIGYHILSPQRSFLDFKNSLLYIEKVERSQI